MRSLLIFLGGVLLILAGIIFMAYSVAEAPTETGEVATTTPAGEPPSYVIEEDTSAVMEIMPSLDREIQFSASVPANARTSITAKIDALKATLRANPLNGGAWYDLALWYNSANDYKGAEEVWLFLKQLTPREPLLYENLGKLYHFNLKEYPKAESHFKKAIELEPNVLSPYLELFDLYRYSYKTNTSAAVDSMKKAIALFPQNTDPYALLGEYYRDGGDNAAARENFTKALDIARANGDVTMIAAIGDALSKLPQ